MSSVVDSNVNLDESLNEFEEFVVSKTTSTTNLSVTLELNMYLEESLLPRTCDFDILTGGRQMELSFLLCRRWLSRDILAIPVSTVAFGSAFSGSGKLINHDCNRLITLLWRH
ncbi:UNVERIFIED_CONTAM: Zinc finger BED domain-containing protein DAYSLEEPER [Sesamum latifolium]|uniref:Zinc finger BED domain-containing protein DAYSLEEPER n=1 Tax=Sesamum latifolium TaxID=2727402 RepID=A0AAW2YBV4_9LAMI